MRNHSVLLMCVLVVAVSLLFIQFDVSQNSEIQDRNLKENNSRVINENVNNGGMWYDDFSDDLYIDSISSVSKVNNGYTVPLSFMEDFEEYYDGDIIVGKNGWVEDLGRPLSSVNSIFRATDSGPSPSNMVGMIYNPDTSHSYHNSKGFAVEKGIIRYHVSTDRIWSGLSNAQSTMLTLMKDDSAEMGSEDYLLSIIVKNGGIGYQTGKNTTNFIVNSGIVANTWYIVEILFNCVTDSADVFVYDSNMNELGSYNDAPFFTSTDMVRSIQIMTSRDHEGEYTTAYYDNIFLMPVDIEETPSVRSKGIQLPGKNIWSTLKINKDISNGTNIKLNILDRYLNHIHSFEYNPYDEEIDISYLNELGIDEIVLEANFELNNFHSPILKGWGVEWMKEGAWRDTFLTTLKSEVFDDVVFRKNEVKVEPGETVGYIISEKVRLDDKCYWDVLDVDWEVFGGSITLDVIDADTQTIIDGYQNVDEGLTDISDIDPVLHSEIRLKATMSNIGGDSSLLSWSLTWVVNENPDILKVTCLPSSVLRGNPIQIGVDVLDLEQEKNELDVHAFYRLKTTEEWDDLYIDSKEFDYDDRLWKFILVPPITAELGVYDLNISVSDEIGASVSQIIKNRFEVHNNVPTTPSLNIYPRVPKTTDPIIASISNLSQDVEGEEIRYCYNWFINYVEKEEFRSINLTNTQRSILPASETKKGDIIEVEVYSTDGYNNSDTINDMVIVGNSPPEFVEILPSIIYLDEDIPKHHCISPLNFVDDPDQDILTLGIFTMGENLTIEKDDHSSISIFPFPNWTGDQNITFTISDGEAEISFDVKVEVRPINDPPFGTIISPSGNLDFLVGENISFNASAGDVDGDELHIYWISDKLGMNDPIGIGKRIEINFSNPGILNISCMVSDGYYNINIGTLELNITQEEIEDKNGNSSNKGGNNIWLFVIIICTLCIIIIALTLFILFKIRKQKITPIPYESPPQATDAIDPNMAQQKSYIAPSGFDNNTNDVGALGSSEY